MPGSPTESISHASILSLGFTHSDQTGDDLADSPPDTEQSKEVLVFTGNEFDEQGSVHGQVSADTEADERDEKAKRTEVWC